jgi:hypothetical protein
MYSRSPWEQCRLGEPASLLRDRNLLRVWISALAVLTHTAFGPLIRPCIYKWCGNPVPLGSAVPLMIMCGYRKT